MARHLTVVYTINDDAAFEQERARIFELLKHSAQEIENAPYTVTAISNDHEIQRTHWMEQAAENLDDDFLPEVIESIAGHPSITSVESLDEFIKYPNSK